MSQIAASFTLYKSRRVEVMSTNGIEQGLDWWHTLSRADKARWLQCAATPEEIDADLNSPDPEIRAAAGIAAVGDAWIAFRAGQLTKEPS